MNDARAEAASAAVKCEKVFVYGTLLKGERNARWAGDAIREGAWVRGKVYDTRCGYPAIVTDPDSTARVWGEVLTTDAEGLANMDVLEGVASGLYLRKRVKAMTHGGEVDCWVYELARGLPAGAIRIKCGNWASYARGFEK